MSQLNAYYRLPDGSFRERYGLSFEDFVPGQRFLHRPGITLSQQENVDESLDTLNAAMLHYDAHYAGKTAWKQPLLVSTITLKRAIGMASKTFARRRAIRRFDEIAMTAPLFGGDTIYSASEVLGAVSSDDLNCGTLTVRTTVTKQDGVLAGRFVWQGEIWKRGFGPDNDLGEPCAEPRFSAYRTMPDGAMMEQQGLFFEEFGLNERFIHYPRRSFHEFELVEQARRALDIDPAWHDLTARAPGERLRVAETIVIGAATALTTRTFGRVVANLGWTGTELSRPVLAGDTIEASSSIAAIRESKSRPGEGVLTVDTTVCNQDGISVLTFRRNLLVYRREGAPYEKAGY